MNIRVVNYCEILKPNTVWGPRRIPDFELILAIRGMFEFENHGNGEKVVQRPGEVLTIYPDELHTYRLRPGEDKAFFSCIHLMPENREETPPRLCYFSPEHAVFELFRRMNQLFQRPARHTPEQLSCLGRLIWLYLLDAPPDEQVNNRLSEMLDYLDENLLRHPTRSDLARKFNLTPQRVNAVFRERLRISPGGYVHHQLALRAYGILHDEQLSVKETAERLGFPDPHYFSRIFKKVYGFPPSSVHL